jgi:hypothetical protein
MELQERPLAKDRLTEPDLPRSQVSIVRVGTPSGNLWFIATVLIGLVGVACVATLVYREVRELNSDWDANAERKIRSDIADVMEASCDDDPDICTHAMQHQIKCLEMTFFRQCKRSCCDRDHMPLDNACGTCTQTRGLSHWWR